MSVFRGVLSEAITESVRDAFSFRRAKTIMISSPNDATGPILLETMLFSDDVIVQFSDDEPVEW